MLTLTFCYCVIFPGANAIAIVFSKDTFDYSKKGGKIMIAHKWMEEPPQMEDRNQLTE
jgi:hypothetical protein